VCIESADCTDECATVHGVSEMEVKDTMKARMKEHKRRMIANQRERKQAGINNILLKIKNEIVESEESVSSLYTPIPSLNSLLQNQLDPTVSSPTCPSFWSSIPSTCTPDQAVLDSRTATDRMLRGEAARQRKYLKKLEAKLQCGEITEKEMEEMLDKFGRKNLKDNSDDHDSFSLLNSSRGLRKRQQVENIASLFQMFGERKIVVDFGSGSGNLCLALASFYRNTTFVFADQNPQSLEILKNRAAEAGLTNVRIKQFSFNVENLGEFIKDLEAELGSVFDLGIGLHCCGRFTDLVMEVSRMAMADCVVVPCCNGKMDKEYEILANNKEPSEENIETANVTKYPRSAQVSGLISRDEYFLLSRAADDDDNYDAKCVIEYDRAAWAREHYDQVSLLRMEPVSSTPKHHVLYCHYNKH